MTTGTKLKYFRNRAGISQLELELSIGASTGSISRIENGIINPTKETLLKISKELDLTNEETLILMNDNLDLNFNNVSIESYIKAIEKLLSVRLTNNELDFNYAQGSQAVIEQCTSTLYKSNSEVRFMGNPTYFREIYPEKIDLIDYIRPRIKQHKNAKILLNLGDRDIDSLPDESYLREKRTLSNQRLDFMLNVNDKSIVLIGLNNTITSFEILNKNLVSAANKLFTEYWFRS